MKKIAVIFVHPDFDQSIINKQWIDELKKYPERYTVHHLDKLYPDGIIDVETEQQLVEEHDIIVFQFPFYWFNCPPLLKKWFDEVLTHGWAYGRNSEYKLSGKKIAMAITAGIKKEDYTPEGKYKYTLEQLTAPFEVTFGYIRADYRSFFAFYGAEHNPSKERIEESAKDYIRFLENM